MTEQQLFEKIGRLEMARDEILVNYQTFLGIVMAIKRGEISMDRMTFDANGVWTLAPAIAATEEKDGSAA